MAEPLPRDWWTTSYVDTFLGIAPCAIRAYEARGQMPAADSAPHAATIRGQRCPLAWWRSKVAGRGDVVNHDPQARRQLRRIDRWRRIWAASRNHLASRSILADAQLAFMRRVQAAAQRNLSRRWPRVGLAGISGRWPMPWTRRKAVAGVS